MRMPLSVLAVAAWTAVAVLPAAAQSDAQSCAQATGDAAIGACHRLLEDVTTGCQSIIADRYPFVRGARGDVPLDDFARLFGAGGLLERFFGTYLARYVDTAGPQWTWRQGSANLVSAAALQAFQNAAWIRDAFFRDGNGPIMTLTVSANPGVSATFESGGTTIAHGAPPSVLRWPGLSQRTMIRFTPAGGQPVSIGRDGPWSLFRVLEAGNSRPRGQTASAQYLMAGQLLRYEFTVMSGAPGNNPLDLGMLRQFQCPPGN
jgi:type VI secretion system protein ImpL